MYERDVSRMWCQRSTIPSACALFQMLVDTWLDVFNFDGDPESERRKTVGEILRQTMFVGFR